MLSAIVFTGSTVTSDSALAGAFMLTANGLEGRTVLSNHTYSYYLGNAPGRRLSARLYRRLSCHARHLLDHISNRQPIPGERRP